MNSRVLPCILVPLLVAGVSSAQTIDASGNILLQTISTDAARSWIDGGFGRLQGGTDEPGRSEEALVGELNLGIEWLPSTRTAFWVHGVARDETQAVEEWSGGIVEAWGEMRFARDSANELRVRAGNMILPTSRENTEAFWSSPYLVSFSAINSWIAEEIRPTGIDVQYRWDDGSRSFRLGGTGFVGNDTPGTLLAWRGWAVGNRLTAFGEGLPLPPLRSLAEDFTAQGPVTTPYGDELDGRAGWSARARFDQWARLTVQATHYDNRGDRELHGDEYAWRTRFDLFAVEVRPGAGFTLASEYMTGRTIMGPPTGVRVDADFDAVYALVSWKRAWFRVSARHDRFRTIERDFSPAENNDEDGRANAIAIAIEPGDSFRVALEFLDVDVEREASLDSGGPLQNGGDAILFQIRYGF